LKYEKNSRKQKKLMKYTKKKFKFSQFEQEVLNNVRKASEKNREKNKKIKILPECLSWLSGKRPFPEC